MLRSRSSFPRPETGADPLPATAATHRNQLRLPAQAEQLTRARRFVREAAADFGLDDRAAYEFIYAVNEAVTNAIKHGRPAPDGTIGLMMQAEGDALICSVQDRGPFVPPAAFAGPHLAESGRGFALMAALTTDLELAIAPGATVVRLVKRRTRDEATDA